jgi:lycopene beta-cyclase
MAASASRRILVLGAGLSGLSLAGALLREGYRGELVLVDRRTAHGADRTWCFWDVSPTAFTRLARHRWHAWRVVTGRGEAVQRSASHPYLHLDAADVYAAALAPLAAHPKVELRLGERVLDAAEGAEGVVVRTDAGILEADLAIDALAAGSPLLRVGRHSAEVELDQHFLGQLVELDRPAFEPGVATLMDFRVPQEAALHFTYVLPFSPTRALVEDTFIGGPSLPPGRRRAAIAAWLADRAGSAEWRVEREERGRIPMSTRSFPLRPGERILAAGTAAGAVRPSSGYAFLRIQRHCAALARALARGGPPPRRLAHPRHDALDRIFLRALVADPGAFPERFRKLVERTPAASFARFMGDASTPLDELRVIAALPKRPFLAAAARG